MVGLGVLASVVVLVVVMAARRSSDLAGPTDRRVLSAEDLQRAADAGLVTPAQAAALLELAGPPARSGHVPAGAPREASAAIEIVGYLGAVLAMIGGATLVGRSWDLLASWSRLTIVGGLALGLWGAGAALDESSAVLWRLRGFLWLLSSAGVAFFTSLLGADVLDWSPEPVAVLAGAMTALHAGSLWRGRDRPAQHLAFFASAVGGLAGAGAWADGPGLVGIVLWSFGLTWLWLARRHTVVPEAIAFVAAPGLMLVAAGVTGGSWESIAPLFGLLTAGGLLAAGTVLREFVITGIGVAGVFVYLPMAGAQYFGETVGVPIVLLAAGTMLIVLMVILLRRGAGPRPLPPFAGT